MKERQNALSFMKRQIDIIFINNRPGSQPTTFLNRDSNKGFFLRILRSFFYRTTPLSVSGYHCNSKVYILIKKEVQRIYSLKFFGLILQENGSESFI